ncbi:MAG: biotin--[Bacteroidaceae bacterium]|nr:biotin--[acetyl-CoA-carboxylase] ligase [Bacteroidaceae bacterium]
MANDIYLKRLDVVDSTNRYVRDEAVALWSEACGKSVVAVTAAHQTAGRGQRGNVWQSERGVNLLLTIIVRPGCALEVSKQFLLSQTVAVAVHSAMKRYAIDTKLKWPNDVYVGNRKLAGILVELDYSGAFVEQAIIGIGLNVNQTSFPEMERVPVSMKMLLDKEISVDDVLTDVLDEFSRYYSEMLGGCKEGIASEYQELLLGFGEQREFIDADGRFMAVIEGVEPCGHLVVRRADGALCRYAFKEIEQML